MEFNLSDYTVSIHYDRRLYKEDLSGSIAHANMLAKQGIITQKEARSICNGLKSIKGEIEKGIFPWSPEHEDIHMNIESRLFDKIGLVAGKLHTARSRNDQIALDLRLYLKEAIHNTLNGILNLQKAILDKAGTHRDLILPGYTHLQRAQPVLFAHHLLAYFEMLQRDRQRFNQCHAEVDVMPLGSGALAGVPYPVDRQFLASELGFSKISANSMDAVSDRDFIIQYQSCSAMCIMHLSRLSEEIILWSSHEFGFITLGSNLSTGSSIMPQKANPDFAELARGKTGRIYGHLIGILTVLKGLPLTYNRDLQEDKEGLFDTVDTIVSTLAVMTNIITNMKINTNILSRASEEGNMMATDLADYLVGKGLPFRASHKIVKDISYYAKAQNKEIHELSLQEYESFSNHFKKDVLKISASSSVESRDVHGGTASRQVRKALRMAQKQVEAT